MTNEVEHEGVRRAVGKAAGEKIIFTVIDGCPNGGGVDQLCASSTEGKYHSAHRKPLVNLFFHEAKKNGGHRLKALKLTICHRSGHSDTVTTSPEVLVTMFLYPA